MLMGSIIIAALIALSGCKKGTDAAGSGGSGSGSARAMKLQLNWHAEPQFGGFYAAQENHLFAKDGVNVEVVAGGAGTPTVQMAGSGTVDFAVVSADELLLARERGNDVVALFAVYQTCPQGIMTHASRGFKTIGDIFGTSGTVAMQKGLPYADFLQRKYGFNKVNIVPSPGGDLTLFLKDPMYSMQCFVTSEPIAARRAGGDPQTFLVADAGYNPYTTVLVTRGELLRSRGNDVKAVVAACREGWQAYLGDPAPTNAAMQKLNPGMDAATFVASAEAQKPLIETEQTRAHGLGSMTRERWQTLAQQLVDLGVIKNAPPPEACFVEVAPVAATTQPAANVAQ